MKILKGKKALKMLIEKLKLENGVAPSFISLSREHIDTLSMENNYKIMLRSEIFEWCKENINGYVAFGEYTRIYFSNDTDLINFKLRWC